MHLSLRAELFSNRLSNASLNPKQIRRELNVTISLLQCKNVTLKTKINIKRTYSPPILLLPFSALVYKILVSVSSLWIHHSSKVFQKLKSNKKDTIDCGEDLAT
jgi:hypothetical protein